MLTDFFVEVPQKVPSEIHEKSPGISPGILSSISSEIPQENSQKILVQVFPGSFLEDSQILLSLHGLHHKLILVLWNRLVFFRESPEKYLKKALGF